MTFIESVADGKFSSAIHRTKLNYTVGHRELMLVVLCAGRREILISPLGGEGIFPTCGPSWAAVSPSSI